MATLSPVLVDFERAVDEPVGQREAGLDLHPIAEIAADNNRLQHDLVVGVERRDAHALRAEDERGEREWRSVLGSAGMWKWTSAKAPGHSFPSGLSACSSISAVREFSASAFEVDDQLRLESLLLAGQMQRRLDAGRESPRKAWGTFT